MKRLIEIPFRKRWPIRLFSSICHHHHLDTYINDAISTLTPPVSNRLMFKGKQLQVMIVGGPNQRHDFHHQYGEELFFQLRGSMILDVMENNVRGHIHIPEGHFFRLPAQIPHSPQRFGGTVGIVIERTRLNTELDSLSWYDHYSGDILYQEIFYCEDLGTQLKPIIQRFQESKYYDMTKEARIFANVPNNSALRSVEGRTQPFDLAVATEPHQSSKLPRSFRMIDGEFIVDICQGIGEFSMPKLRNGDIFLWQRRGSSTIVYGDNEKQLQEGSVCFLDANLDGGKGFICQDSTNGTISIITNRVFQGFLN